MAKPNSTPAADPPPSPALLRWRQRRARLRRLVGHAGFRRGVGLLLVGAALVGTIRAATAPLGEARKLWQGAATDIPAYNIPYRKMPTTALTERFAEADQVYFTLHGIPWQDHESGLLSLYYTTCYTAFPARLRLSDGHLWNANADDFHAQLLDPGPPPGPGEVQAVAQPRWLAGGWALSYRELPPSAVVGVEGAAEATGQGAGRVVPNAESPAPDRAP